jgi:hypothetical protein
MFNVEKTSDHVLALGNVRHGGWLMELKLLREIGMSATLAYYANTIKEQLRDDGNGHAMVWAMGPVTGRRTRFCAISSLLVSQ